MQREVLRNRQLADKRSIVHLSFAGRRSGGVRDRPPRRTGSRRRPKSPPTSRFTCGDTPPTDEEIARARTTVEGDLARGEADAIGRARRLGFAAAIARDPDYGAEYRRQLDELTPIELQAAAARFLQAGVLTVAVALPEGSSAGRDETLAALQPRLEALLAGALGPRRPLHAASARPSRSAAATRSGSSVPPACGCSCFAIAPLRSSPWRPPGSAGLRRDDPASGGVALAHRRAARSRHAHPLRHRDRVRDARDRRRPRGLRDAGRLRAARRLPSAPPRPGPVAASRTACCIRASPRTSSTSNGARCWRRLRAAGQAADAGSKAALRLFHETLWPDPPRPAGSRDGTGADARSPARPLPPPLSRSPG